tara:strand:+ start:78 stop:500 length:423 start_codon:yes stop_codon:yes gene_type:complete
MFKTFNLQHVISYFGIFPYLFIIIDRFFLHYMDNNTQTNFIIFYSIIVFVFIGSTNWDLTKKISIIRALYGFLPSFFSVFFILLYLYDYNIVTLLIISFFLQLIIDYYLVYDLQVNKIIFFLLRVPLSALIMISLMVIQL